MARWPTYPRDMPTGLPAYSRINPLGQLGFPNVPYTPYGPLGPRRGGGGGWQPPTSRGTNWAGESWYPELVGELFGRLRGEEQDWRGYLRGLMNYPAGQLGRQLGGQFARSNVAVPVGTDLLARRIMSPVMGQMEALLNRPTSAMQMMTQARSMAGQLAPEFGEYQRTEPGNLNRLMAKYLELIFGEQGGM